MMTKAEAAEKIMQKCKSYNSCGDCSLYVKGKFTNCAIAVMIGVVPARWEDKQAHTVKIKPCPFCGGKADVDVGNYGGLVCYCKKCFSQGKQCNTKEEAIEWWNRRADDGRE